MRSRLQSTYLTVVLLLWGLFCSLGPLWAGEHPAQIIVFNDLPPQASTPAIAAISTSAPVECIELRCSSEMMKAKMATRVSTATPSDVFICLGTRPSLQLKSLGTQRHRAVCLSVRHQVETTGIAANTDYVWFDFAPERVISTLRKLLPNTRRIGFIASSDRAKAPTLIHAMAAAHTAGFSSRLALVPTRRDLARTLTSLLGTVDVLWLLPDPLTTSPDMARYILARALERRRPVIGFSPPFVRAGALFCLGHDYRALGLQILTRANAKTSRAPEGPLHAVVHINRRVVRALGLRLAPSEETIVWEGN